MILGTTMVATLASFWWIRGAHPELPHPNPTRPAVAVAKPHDSIGNRLKDEKSPYLQLHASDPVAWYPWGEEAFAEAAERNLPIFLSIGYSSCYLCHMMQREVFKNSEVAAKMNAYAINILVDREERPDIDRLYMSALQTMTGTGGWPMSFFLTPDRKPFFGATYLPAIGFSEVLTRVHDVWQNRPEKATQWAHEMETYMRDQTVARAHSLPVGERALEKGYDSFSRLYDSQFAGFGTSPKFPRPMILSFLFRYYNRTRERKALDMALATLQHMATGGIYDQVGNGFHRSSERQWQTPHFEKMIYDQALLTIVYLEAFQITHDSEYARVASESLAFTRREMMSPEGAYYSALNAESAPDPSEPQAIEPGAYYVWTQKELLRILGPTDAPVFEFAYGVQARGNALRDPMAALAGKNILYRAHSDRETSLRFSMSEADVASSLARSLRKLKAERDRRPRPALDDKVILSWNALMISALARASEVLENNEYLYDAIRCVEFLESKMLDPQNHRVFRRYRDGERRYDANLQDYAFLIQAFLDLYEASGNIRFLQRGIQLAEEMINIFDDPIRGGFFDTNGKDSTLPVRPRDFLDDTEPTGNSIAVLDLLRLARMTGNEKFEESARRALQFFSGRIQDQPAAMPQFLCALEFSLHPSQEIIIAGHIRDESTDRLLHEIHTRFLPDKVLLLADGGEGQLTISGYLPFVRTVAMKENKATAYVCRSLACSPPTTQPEVLAAVLDGDK